MCVQRFPTGEVGLAQCQCRLPILRSMIEAGHLPTSKLHVQLIVH